MNLFNTSKLKLSPLEIESVENAFIPKEVYIPVHNNYNLLPSTVFEGSILDKYYNANIHSSIPGQVLGSKRIVLANGKTENVAIINLSGEFSYMGKPEKKAEWSLFKQNHILNSLDEKGVLNTFKKPVVISKEFDKAKNVKFNRTLIVRLFDEDLTCATDSYIFSKYTERVLEGSAILAKALNADNIIFLHSVEQLKEVSEIHLSEYDFFNSINACFRKCFSKKIGFGVKEEINFFLKKQKLPQGTFFVDTQTAYSAYEAIALGRPILEKLVQVNSSLLNSSKMFKVRLGTPIKNLILECGGCKTQPKKIVLNGMLKGIAISDLDCPITSDVKSITLLASSEVPDQKQHDCYRCGECYRVCPVHIRPFVLYEYYSNNKALTDTIKTSIKMCTNCGRCNTVCASRIPISKAISILQETIK